MILRFFMISFLCLAVITGLYGCYCLYGVRYIRLQEKINPAVTGTILDSKINLSSASDMYELALKLPKNKTTLCWLNRGKDCGFSERINMRYRFMKGDQLVDTNYIPLSEQLETQWSDNEVILTHFPVRSWNPMPDRLMVVNMQSFEPLAGMNPEIVLRMDSIAIKGRGIFGTVSLMLSGICLVFSSLFYLWRFFRGKR